MMSRMKEDEKNEKIIRGLLKLPANRKCINCNNLGPQYVCTNFWTFICTTCSGLHREFCHRVKSISMSKFTTQEVKALQDGGNERARDIYFKEWDPHCNPLPDSSNTDRLRGFIKHVYVNRRYTGENNSDKPSQGKIDINDSNYSGRGDSFQGISRSAPYNEQLRTGGRNLERNFKYVYGERSPGYNQGDNKRSSRRFEVVDDRVRDDRFGSGNQFSKFEDRRLSNVLTKSEGSSPSRPKDMSSPPVVRPVRDILGDNTLQLHVGDTPKSISTRVLDNSAQTQRTSSSGSLESSDGNPVQLKRVNLGSLIDFDADPEPPTSATPQQSVPRQPHSPLSDGGDWASFDNSGTQNATQATVSGGNLESALSPMSAHGSSPRADMPTLTISTVISSPKDGQQWPITQHQNSSFSADQSPLNPPYNAPVVESQPWGSSAVPSPQGPLPNPAGHLPPPQDLSTMVLSPTGRKELPADLFTAIYPSAPASIPGWQMGPHLSIGYGMQYPMGMVHPQAMPAFPSTLKSTNPFDLGGEPTLAHAPTFPSMASLQGALPNVSEPSPLLRSSSFGNPSQQWILSQQYSSFRPALGQGQYMVQVPSNMHQLPQNNMVMMGHRESSKCELYVW